MPRPQFPQRGGPPGPQSRGGSAPERPGSAAPGRPAGGSSSGEGSGSGGSRLQRAVPRYLRQAGEEHFRKAPPGHTFRLYFGGWTERWELPKDQKLHTVEEVTAFDYGVVKALSAVRGRVLAQAKGDDVFLQEVTSCAPFTTGLGIEHPLENGFAFLDPYGLPYLPGSSVKGVVRRAAEELALFETDNHGWSIPALWWLFGFDATSAYFAPAAKDPKPIEEERTRWREGFRTHVEKLAEKEKELLKAYVHLAFPPKNGRSAPDPLERVLGWIPTDAKSHPELREIHTRGALEFWDVLPEPKDGKLRVDIMNPHYNHYYQQGQPPGDWGSPVPIFFLTLPPGTRFTFVARFRPPRNWPEPVRSYFETSVDGKPRWRSLVESAFAFAFDWLGFGAKTAVGYGRMRSGPPAPMPHLQTPKGFGGGS
jgi:CRISPR-associated protein Cmr6